MLSGKSNGTSENMEVWEFWLRGTPISPKSRGRGCTFPLQQTGTFEVALPCMVNVLEGNCLSRIFFCTWLDIDGGIES